MMRNKLLVALGLLLVFGIFLGCDNGSSPNPDPTPTEPLKAVGPGNWTFVLDTNSTNRSVRSVVQGSNYELKIIVPKRGSSGFDEKTIIVNVSSIVNKKLTLVPVNSADKAEYGETIEVTLDTNGDMFQINGPKIKSGLLVPFGDNSINLDGNWFGWNQSGNTGAPNNFIVNGNTFTVYVTMNTDSLNPEDEIWISVVQGSFSISAENIITFSNLKIWDADKVNWVDIDEWESVANYDQKPTYVPMLIKGVTPTTFTTNIEGVGDQVWTRVPTN